MRAEVFMGRNFLYYFRFVSSNGQVLATSGDGYTSKQSCIHALNLIKLYAKITFLFFSYYYLR